MWAPVTGSMSAILAATDFSAIAFFLQQGLDDQTLITLYFYISLLD